VHSTLRKISLELAGSSQPRGAVERAMEIEPGNEQQMNSLISQETLTAGLRV
jgi:hypothetical protein